MLSYPVKNFNIVGRKHMSTPTLKKTPWYVFVLSVFLAFIIYLVNLYYISYGSTLIFFVSIFISTTLLCFCFGYVWPHTSWHWGLWFCSPMWVIFITMNFIDKGGLVYFMIRSIPPSFITLLCSYTSYAGSELYIKRK